MILDATVDGTALIRFLDLPGQVYRDDTEYCATPIDAVKTSLLRKQFDGHQAILVQIGGKRTIGRVVARLSPTLKDQAGLPLGMLGFFEAENEPQPIAELLRAAIDWLRERGAGEIVGPMDGDTWHRYRFNIGPFDRPPFLMEPYNPPYYIEQWQQAGFVPLEGYYSKRVENVLAAQQELQPILDRVVRRGYVLRKIDLHRFTDELTLLHKLSCEVFSQNFLYEPISLDDFLAMYVPLRAVVDPELVRFAISPEGEPVGFIFSVADYHQALKAMRGKRNIWAKLRFTMLRHQSDTVNIKSMGVLPGHRRSGLGAALMCQAYHDVLAKGFRTANLCLIRDDNPSGRLDGGQGEIMRNYMLYKYMPAA